MSQKFIVRFYLSLIFVICLPFMAHAQGWVSCLNAEIGTCVSGGNTPEVFICDFWGDEEACFWCIDDDNVIVKERGCGGPGYATAPMCDQPECTEESQTQVAAAVVAADFPAHMFLNPALVGR